MDARVMAVLMAKELRDARRSRWFVLFAMAFAALALALGWLGRSGLGILGMTGFNRTAASLLHLVMLIVPLMGLLLGAMAIAPERERGTLLPLLAQPVTAHEVFLGKFLGASAALAAAILLGFGASGLVIARSGGLADVAGYATLVSFTLLLGMAHLALGLLISVRASQGLAAVGAAICAWLGIVLISDLGIIGTAIVLKLSPAQLLWTSLVNPVQAFKIGTMGSLQGTLEHLGPSGRVAMDVFGAGVLPAMAALLVGWTIGPLAAALWLFRRRGAV